MRKTELTIIAAIDPITRVIGKDGKLPWHIPEDLKHFRKLTTPHPIIMGRNTADSLDKALPKRQNIVLTTNPDNYNRDGFHAYLPIRIFGDVEPQFERVPGIDYSKVFIIGGAQIYNLLYPLVDSLEITWVRGFHDGDTKFPYSITPRRWKEVSRENHDEYAFARYERR